MLAGAGQASKAGVVKMIESRLYYCPKCRFSIQRIRIKFLEEFPALFKGMPTLVRFVCPRCETLVTIKEPVELKSQKYFDRSYRQQE